MIQFIITIHLFFVIIYNYNHLNELLIYPEVKGEYRPHFNIAN